MSAYINRQAMEGVALGRLLAPGWESLLLPSDKPQYWVSEDCIVHAVGFENTREEQTIRHVWLSAIPTNVPKVKTDSTWAFQKFQPLAKNNQELYYIPHGAEGSPSMPFSFLTHRTCMK